MSDVFRKRGPYRKRLNNAKTAYEPSIDLLYRMVAVDQETGCHVWQGVPNPKGYGRIGIQGKDYLAHRLSYELQIGPIPDGLFVCHKCDNPACINPEHFFLGTVSDNHADMVSKKRHQMGSKQWRTHLTENDVRAIRSMNCTHREVAEQYGVSRATITAIRLRKNWKHVA